MNIYLQAVGVFVAMAFADFAWAKYTMYLAEKRAHKAAFWSAVIIACGAVTVVSYTESHVLLLPALLGAYVGTLIAVRRDSVVSVTEVTPTRIVCDTPPRPVCDHRNCTVSEADGELLRWSCGRIEG